jgi:hypothetical protein
MPDLVVSFEFLCAFVPVKPFYPEDADPPREATVLLRDLRTPPAFANEPSKKPKPHISHFQFDRRDRQDHANPPVNERGVNAEQGDKHVFVFDQEEVTFHPDGNPPAANGLKPLNKTPLNAVEPSTIAELEYLWWLTGMERVDATRALAKNSLLSGAIHDPKIAARIKLSDGSLSTGRLTPTPWTLKQQVDQRLALSVLYSLPFTDFVDIRFARFDGSAEKWLRLKLRQGQTALHTFIRNSEEDYLFGDTRSSYGKRDLDFEHYYSLAPDTGSTGLPPIPEPVLPTSSGHSACSPLRFKGGVG